MSRTKSDSSASRLQKRTSEPRKLAAQLKYADAKGFRLALIAGEAERAEEVVLVKDLATGEQSRHPRAELTSAVQAALVAR